MTGDSSFALAVVGAHLTGQPLNSQLTDRQATLLKSTRTAPDYRLYALNDLVPRKPALKRVQPGMGFSIEVEVWNMPVEHFGSMMKLIGPPLGIGTIRLEDGSDVKGFICEPYALESAVDISHHGGWRAYLAPLRAGRGE
jgi:allophanate hydrolase